MGTVTSHASMCRFCAVSCPIVVDIEDGIPIRVRGNKASPSYHGFCCTRGYALPEQMTSPHRLLRSMKRHTDGQHRPMAATDAMDEIAAKVKTIVAEHGPSAVALYLGTYAVNYPATSPLAVGWLRALGSPMLFTGQTIDQPGKDIGAALLGHWEAGPQTFTDADVWMMVGANPLVSIGSAMPAQNPGWRLTEAINRGLKLIVIDPRRTQTAQRAYIHIQPRPGEDAALQAAIIHLILAENLHDAVFTAENVAGVDALRRAVAPFTPDYVAARADVPVAQIIEAARIFARGRRGLAGGGTGANMSGRSTLTEYLILCLNTICGRYIKAGEAIPNPGVLLSEATPRAQAGPPRAAVFPDQKASVRDLAMSVAGMPTAALADEILSGRIRALFSVGGNPVAAWPEQTRTMAALKKLDLFVQCDIKMSASAKRADYVIAPKISFEVPTFSYITESIELFYAIWGFAEPFGLYAPRLMKPPPGADVLEEWEFFYGLAQRMGLQLQLQYADSVNGCRRKSRAPVDLDMVRQPTTEDLYELMTRGSRVPLDEVKKYPNGTLFPSTIVTAPKDPSCIARLDVANVRMMTELQEVADEHGQDLEDYPFRLISRRSAHVYNSTGRDLPMLARKGGTYNPAFMHPDDLASLGLVDGAVVEITSLHGAIQGIVEADQTLRRGLVSMSHAFGDVPGEPTDIRRVGSNTSQLTSVADSYDRHSGIPRMSAVPVKVVAVHKV